MALEKAGAWTLFAMALRQVDSTPRLARSCEVRLGNDQPADDVSMMDRGQLTRQARNSGGGGYLVEAVRTRIRRF